MIEALVENRNGLAAQVLETSAPKAAEFGVKIVSLAIKDVMFPGELKRAFAEELKARKEAQAKLEQARGETAVLRNLANAGKLVGDNPGLMNLKVLQTMAEITKGSNNNMYMDLSKSIQDLMVFTQGED